MSSQILTTHVGSLPRPEDLIRTMFAKQEGVPAYVVFHNSTLAEIASRRPSTIAELASVPGVGPAKLDRYGSELLEALAAA